MSAVHTAGTSALRLVGDQWRSASLRLVPSPGRRAPRAAFVGVATEARVVPGVHLVVAVTVYGADDEEKEALGALIGRKGERLSALQHLVNLMLSRKMGTWTRVLVDVEYYRGRRERQLVEVATRAADRVSETGQMLQLEPMSALERRWVHLALRDVEGVTTQSIGEEPTRRVVVLKA